MLFNSIQYIFFLLLVVVVYWCIPQKIRYIWLLGASYFFYMQWNSLYAILLFSCTALTYLCGRTIGWIRNSETDYQRRRMQQKVCFVICILLNLGILGFFKYFDFGIRLVNRILGCLHINEINWNYSILLPVGISFYTLQALGYLIDVYRGDIYPEKNFLKYALFVSFFPQLVAGPIERSQNLLRQLQTSHSFSYENLRKGCLLILYGLFLKMVIADRAAIIVNTVYGDSVTYHGFYIIVATVLFSIQIYCDFYGYSTIARGSALLMGIYLMDNFEAPYYARSVKEFWRRWHISLSGWFRDYLYIPMGGNRKGTLRKEGNLLAVFMVSGLWHGASIAFVFWGFLNGIYQVIGDIVSEICEWGTDYMCNLTGRPIRLGCQNKTDTFSRKLLQNIFTFFIVTFAWLFFRAGGMQEATKIIRNIFTEFNWMILFDGSIYDLGVAPHYMHVLCGSILVLGMVDYYKYHKRNIADCFLEQQWWFRVIGIMLMIFTILLYGCYGTLYDIQQFIYFQF